MKKILALFLAFCMFISVMTVCTVSADEDSFNDDLASTVSVGDADVIGDADGDGVVTKDDAIYVLLYTFFEDFYPANQDFDFDGDGYVTKGDAIYLLMYTFMPDLYPLPTPEVDTPITAPEGSIAFFNPSAITEDINGIIGDQKSVAITGSTGIASLAAHSQSGSAGVLVSLINDNGEKAVRLTNTSTSGTYNQLYINFDPAVFSGQRQLYFTLTFRFSDGYECNDATRGRAFLARLNASGQNDYTVITADDLSNKNYSEWTTVTFTITPAKDADPTSIYFLNFAGHGDYFDIKSLAIFDEEPAPAVDMHESNVLQFAPGDGATDSTSGWYNGTYNYCPSVIVEDDGTAYMYYCTNSPASTVVDYVACRVGTDKDGDGAYSWGDEQIVLKPGKKDNPTSGWDYEHVCDPSVIKGEFTYKGENYSYMMAYLGCKLTNSKDNETGIAVAKSATGPFVKIDANPIVDFDYDPAVTTNQWGAAQASLVNKGTGGKVWLFYTYGGSQTVIKVSECDFSNLDAPVIGEPKTLTLNGLKTISGGTDTWFNNADFAYDAKSNRFIVASDCHPLPQSDDHPNNVAKAFRIMYIYADKLETGTWTNYKQVGEAQTGFARNHNVCLARDAYGNILENEYLTVFYTAANTASSNNGSLNSYRIYNYNVVFP